MVDYIAISPEAKETLLSRLNRSDRILSRYFCDFELFGDDECEHGYFCFKKKLVENGQRLRFFGDSDKFSVKLGRGCRRYILEYMVPCDNDFLKTFDLTKTVDENTLWETYYADMRKRGEDLGNTVETIKKTPPLFLTEEQKEVIRRDYQAECDQIDVYHRNHNPEAVDDLIISKLINTYSKKSAVIVDIIGKK